MSQKPRKAHSLVVDQHKLVGQDSVEGQHITVGQHRDPDDSAGVADHVSSSFESLIDDLQELSEISTEELIVCAHCHTAITHHVHRIQVLQSHQHCFTNPAGIIYNIRCFSEALGCLILGEATIKDSWFGGFSWQIAFCDCCGEHLGWYYQGIREGNATQYFYGLIGNRLKDSVN